MKVILLLTCMHATFFTRLISGSAIHAPLDVISYDDISPDERKELNYLHDKYGRPKRSGSGSGSGDILESLKLAIGQGIKNKIGEIAKGSAAATARLSSSSSSHGYSYHHSPHPPESYDHKSLDFWSLKKSILNTLLQAVKAIKGGVIAVKGQLIKGSGYLTAATGKLIVSKGDAVTNLGKKIAASAVLVPYNGHSSTGHAEYGPPPENHYSAPSAPEDFYHGAPSAPAPDFHGPDHHYPYHDDETPHKGPSGLLVLKKIHGDHQHHHEESKIPPFKPIEPSGPSFGTIVGKFLSASSSLDPHKPEPFGNSAAGDIHPYQSHSDQYFDVSETKNHHDVAPSASGYVINDEPPPKKDMPVEKPSDDSPFEKEPGYLSQNFEDYIRSSPRKKPQAATTNSIPQNAQKLSALQVGNLPEPSKPSTSAQAFAQNEFDYTSLNVQNLPSAPSPSATYTKGTYDLYNLPSIDDYPKGFPSSSGGLSTLQSSKGEVPISLLGPTSIGQNMYEPSQPPSVIDFTKNYHQQAFDASAGNLIGQYSNEVPNYYNLPPNSIQNVQGVQVPKQYIPSPTQHTVRRPTRLIHYDPTPSSSRHRSKSHRTKHPSITYKRPSSSTRTATSKHKPKQTYDVVKSIAYELGPNGPKRLT